MILLRKSGSRTACGRRDTFSGRKCKTSARMARQGWRGSCPGWTTSALTEATKTGLPGNKKWSWWAVTPTQPYFTASFPLTASLNTICALPVLCSTTTTTSETVWLRETNCELWRARGSPDRRLARYRKSPRRYTDSRRARHLRGPGLTLSSASPSQ